MKPSVPELDDALTALGQAAEGLATGASLTAAVLDALPHEVIVKTTDGRILLANRAAAERLGEPAEALVGRWYLDFVPDGLSRERILAEEAVLVRTGVPVTNGEDLVVDAAGLPRVRETTKVRAVGADGSVVVACISVDISRRRDAEQALRRRAFYDPLTGLANRDLFVERIEHAIARTSRRGARRFSVLFMDLDAFKDVNDAQGHQCGDEMLVEVAQRVTECVRPGDTVSRFGGDEFGILLEEVDDPSEAVAIAERIHAVMARPFQVGDDARHFVSTSIGIASFVGTVDNAGDLLRDADVAMYGAKREGPGRTQVFVETMRDEALSFTRTKNELRQAVDRGELRLHYQPVIRLGDGLLCGLEALVRWAHPQRGLIPPGVFIPIAERAGILPHLERWVLGEACSQMRAWVERYRLAPYVRMSVNVSAGHLAEPDFLDHTIDTLETIRLDPSRLTIELTESSLVRNTVSTGRNLSGLRAIGVAVALDDFGTGYSSLSHLTRFALDEIKVDRSFIAHIEAQDSRAKIIRSTVALGKNLGLQVTAEGVETREQLAFLRELGCHFAQGFLFSRPYAAETVEGLLARGGRWKVGGDGAFEG